jgi:hypothetical protein
VEALEKDVDKMGGLKIKIYIKSDFFLKKTFQRRLHLLYCFPYLVLPS